MHHSSGGRGGPMRPIRPIDHQHPSMTPQGVPAGRSVPIPRPLGRHHLQKPHQPTSHTQPRLPSQQHASQSSSAIMTPRVPSQNAPTLDLNKVSPVASASTVLTPEDAKLCDVLEKLIQEMKNSSLKPTESRRLVEV